ncbi:DNA polymerase alpha catalytic subunit, putative [Ixodes scapularis]|uniref:DNA polymerase n=1 Tax=Ixodes scapularis TaxID=6945 RepID=B7QFQ4_IXOSC|nr:DNA polymerase alpha catalytic subunit, putative [Ixodes scapularis]|eukprot:XP_002414368.1 DNA polymerase alpha catalytic subunit, putative [Ixodes scapularis]
MPLCETSGAEWAGTVVSRRQPEDKEEVKIEQFDTQELSCDYNIEEDSPPSPLAEAPHENADVKVESLPLVENENGEKVVRFFWLDAYEDYFKNPGVVHLFGKVKLLDASTYASCTVTVCNIPRKVYLLPRPFAVTKRYAFDKEGVPAEAEYLEIVYPVVLSKPGDLVVAKSESAPPLVVMSLSIRTVPNDATNQNEGHDVQSYDLNVLLHRMITNKIPNWSRLGRLKRGNAAVLVKADKQMTPGRLVCDLKISSKELVQCKSYDLTELARTLLHKQRLELGPERLQSMYSSSAQLLKLVDLTMMDAEFCLRLMSELNVLPLALQITNIAGNVLSRTLLGGRSQRNEYLLLHAFSDRNYICPDKSFKKQAVKVRLREASLLHSSIDAIIRHPTTTRRNSRLPKTNPRKVQPTAVVWSWSPKKDSMTPSSCSWTSTAYTPPSSKSTTSASRPWTCPRVAATRRARAQAEDQIPELPSSSAEPGVLPSEIRKLVESRRQVKNLMKAADVGADLYQQYDIRQKALKLTANSMYGCLGFAQSRFFAKPLAALITSRGREILMQTKELVEKMGLDVIYGDTDSIMINTNSRDLKEVSKLGNKVKAEINKLYKQLEIDIDGIFKSMLLLKKKKYAALVVSVGPNGQVSTSKQLKGLDVVRRDWSELARKTGEYVIDELLSDNSREDIVEKIHSYLMQLAAKIQGDLLPLSDFCVTKDGSSQTATQRAYHPEELKGNDSLSIDKQYYLAQQIHPVVARICAPIDGTDAAMIAEVLGLNPAHYRHYNHNEEDDTERRLNDGGASGLALYKSCERVKLRCPSEGCTAVIAVEDIFERTGVELRFVLEECPQCKTALCGYINALCNQVTLFIRDCISKFYAGWLVCEDSVCCHRTRRLPLRFVKASPLCFACERSVMHPEYKTSDLYNQLRYLSKLFDFSRAVASLPESDKTFHPTNNTLTPSQLILDPIIFRSGSLPLKRRTQWHGGW